MTDVAYALPGGMEDEETVDVFITCSLEDRDRVQPIATALEASGLTVWWDRATLSGADYQAQVDGAMKRARAVLACWSSSAAASETVLSESDYARLNEKLTAVSLDEVELPRPFDRGTVQDFADWSGDRDDPAFRTLLNRINSSFDAPKALPVPVYRRWMIGTAIASGLLFLLLVVANLGGFLDAVSPRPDLNRNELATIVNQVKQQGRLNAIENQAPDLGAPCQHIIELAVHAVMNSSRRERRDAQSALADGRLNEAAEELQRQAVIQESVGGRQASRAARNYFLSGALFSASETERAIENYRKSLDLMPENHDVAYALGALFGRLGQLNEAENYYSLMQDWSETKSDVWRARAFSGLGDVAWRRGDYLLASEHYTATSNLLANTPETETHARSLINTGWSLSHADLLSEAFVLAQRSQAYFQDNALSKWEMEVLRLLGYLHSTRDDLVSAREFYAASSELASELDDGEVQGRLLLDQASLLMMDGQLDEAEVLAHDGLEIAKSIQSRALEAHVFDLLATLQRQAGQFDEAQLYHKQALRLFDALALRESLISQYRSASLTEEQRGDFQRAVEFLVDGRAIAQKDKSLHQMGEIHFDLARLNSGVERFSEAFNSLDDAWTVFSVTGNFSGLGEVADLRGDVFLATEETRNAIDSYEAASDQFMNAGHQDKAVNVLLKGVEVAISEDMSSKALELAERAQERLGEAVQFPLRFATSHALGRAYLSTRKFSDSIDIARTNIELLEQAEDEDGVTLTQRVDARLLLARALKESGRISRARPYFRQAASLLNEAGAPFKARAELILKEAQSP